ncbi:hypothetical protein BT69DRAFT_1332545 [Atractiella rhizophila]|nr:hypothetical protein BT69DRAFT_1332545 [Atractiella rhizophila]
MVLSKDEVERYMDNPVIDCKGKGYFFPPVLQSDGTGILKGCDLTKGRPNWDESGTISTPLMLDVNENPSQPLKERDEAGVRKLLRLWVPDLAEKEFTKTRICWDSESFDKSWIISSHPSSPKSLFLATGGSRHSFKNLTNVGKYVVECLEGKNREEWRWRPEKVVSDWAKDREDIKSVLGW